MRRPNCARLFAALVLLAGCASSQHQGAGMTVTKSGAETIVPVELDDYVIRMPETIPAGDVVFKLNNVGKHEHTIRVSGQGVTAETPHYLKPGESAEIRAHLNPGTYHVACPVGPHAALGMRLDLTVE